MQSWGSCVGFVDDKAAVVFLTHLQFSSMPCMLLQYLKLDNSCSRPRHYAKDTVVEVDIV
jgi:hypothetical protein